MRRTSRMIVASVLALGTAVPAASAQELVVGFEGRQHLVSVLGHRAQTGEGTNQGHVLAVLGLFNEPGILPAADRRRTVYTAI